jgi:hypothetical protein
MADGATDQLASCSTCARVTHFHGCPIRAHGFNQREFCVSQRVAVRP